MGLLGKVVTFRELFGNAQPAIGMVHLLPLPGSPGFAGDLDAIYARALADARALTEAGFDGLLVENLGDEPYLVGELRLETITCIAAIARDVRRASPLPLGVNVQFNVWRAELAVAAAVQAAFIRAEVFVDTVVSAMGIVPPCAGEFQRYRRELGLPVLTLADIHTKYTRSIYPANLKTSAIRAVEAGANALIITGEATGQATSMEAVETVKQTVELPILVGSGVRASTVSQILAVADGLIVGSSIKEGGSAREPICLPRAIEFMRAVRTVRTQKAGVSA